MFSQKEDLSLISNLCGSNRENIVQLPFSTAKNGELAFKP